MVGESDESLYLANTDNILMELSLTGESGLSSRSIRSAPESTLSLSWVLKVVQMAGTCADDGEGGSA